MKNLANYILENSEFLNLKNMYDNNTIIYIKYFLDKNIKTIFGKTEFEINGSENSEISIDKVIGDNNSINIDFLTDHYSFICKDNTIVLKSIDDSEIYSEIEYNPSTNTYNDIIISKLDGISTKENLTVNLNVPISFNYQKATINGEEIKESPLYTMKSILYSPSDLEYFKFTSSNEEKKYNSFLKNIIDAIKDDSLIPVIENQIPYNVFEILENKSNEYQKTRTR